MKSYFKTSFQYSESVFCTNMVHAETVADVEAYYRNVEETILNYEDEDSMVDDCRECPNKSNCKSQCMETKPVYNPVLENWQ